MAAFLPLGDGVPRRRRDLARGVSGSSRRSSSSWSSRSPRGSAPRSAAPCSAVPMRPCCSGILAVVLLTAGATEALNVSAAVGAFLAGIAFSGPAADRARSLLVPLRAVSSPACSSCSSGSRSIRGRFHPRCPAAIALAVVGALRPSTTRAGSAPDTPGWWRARLRAGVGLIARGEFSIVIAGIAVASGAEPEASVRSRLPTCCSSRSAGRCSREWPIQRPPCRQRPRSRGASEARHARR